MTLEKINLLNLTVYPMRLRPLLTKVTLLISDHYQSYILYHFAQHYYNENKNIKISNIVQWLGRLCVHERCRKFGIFIW